MVSASIRVAIITGSEKSLKVVKQGGKVVEMPRRKKICKHYRPNNSQVQQKTTSRAMHIKSCKRRIGFKRDSVRAPA